MSLMEGTFRGPQDTPYENGTFVVRIEIPVRYPFEPPKVKFLTKVWHPNISSKTGVICLDILKGQWSPTLTLKTTILSIQALMSSPVPEDPQDAVVARQYLEDEALWKDTAAMWTERCAMPEQRRHRVNSLILKMRDMGFTKDASLKALEDSNWDMQAAIDRLVTDVLDG
mmetsp:Transcript_34430/g.47986  ORF Transcript_34430/g.47986 Transcript_34430/m.47986 type:complete len:170 (-) Transcript_34430:86-595(-)